MKTLITLLMLFVIDIYSQSLAPVQSVFMQGNNINSVFMTNGILNYDKITFPRRETIEVEYDLMYFSAQWPCAAR